MPFCIMWPAAVERMGHAMRDVANEYRQKAVELCAKAKQQSDLAIKVEYENLAFHYMDLAEEAEKLALRKSSAA